jgi:aerobic carbon-monoxide dehydrogenase large subunit
MFERGFERKIRSNTEMDYTLLRTEDARLITGRGTFVRNQAAPEARHCAFVRSTQAFARFSLKIGESAPQVWVFAGANCQDARLPMPNPVSPLLHAMEAPVLPLDTTTYVGQPLALIIAENAESAHAAAERCHVSYSPLAAEPFSPSYAIEHAWGNAEIPAAQFEAHCTHSQPRVAAAAMEPRATIAQWDDAAQTLTIWLQCQAVTRARDDIAALLALPKENVRVIAPDVGGAFGAKASLSPEDFALALAARHFKSTLRWSASRSEEMLSAPHGRGATLTGALRVDAQGKFIALDATLQFPLGAWLPYSAAIPLRNAARILPGPYRVPNGNIRGTATQSHTTPINIYRGAGRPEAALLMERLVDRAAKAAKIDPLMIRLHNIIPAAQFPYETPTNERYDAGDFEQLLRRSAAKFDYENERLAQTQRRAHGELIGIGIALYVEPCGQGFESARVTLHADGRVTVASGSSAQGQGHETTFAQIAAETLQCGTSQIEITHGDTAHNPEGIGALASRSIAIGGSAVKLACESALAKKRAGGPCPIVAEMKYTAPHEGWSSGCVMARMAVDRETGVPTIEKMVWIDDAGRIISPALAHGQLVGGAAQGIGQAMMERIAYDANGQLLTGSWMDYAMPRATDMPAVEIENIATKSDANALGAKGVGEAGCIGVPAALINAACDALTDFNTDDLSFPLTPESLWRTMYFQKT